MLGIEKQLAGDLHFCVNDRSCGGSYCIRSIVEVSSLTAVELHYGMRSLSESLVST